METLETTKWCPCCKQMQDVDLFRDLQGQVRETCEDCRFSEQDEFKAEKELERAQRRQLAKFRRIFMRRERGVESKVKEEKEFWNLTSDPWPGMFKGMGLHANYCPLM